MLQFAIIHRIKLGAGTPLDKAPGVAQRHWRSLSVGTLSPSPEERQCKKCGVVKPITEYGVHAGCRGGHLPQCKSCVAAKQRNYNAENRDLIRERRAADYAAHPERYKARVKAYRDQNREQIEAKKRSYNVANPEKVKGWKDDWYRKNRQRQLGRARERREANPGLHRAYQRIWLTQNRDKDRARGARRRARKKNAPVVDFTAAQWQELLFYFDNRCAYCGCRSSPLHQEHMIPLSRGGSHTLENIVPACMECNYRKSTRTLIEILEVLL